MHEARTAHRIIIIIICSHQTQKQSLTAANSDQSASPCPHVFLIRTGYYCLYVCVRARSVALGVFFRKRKELRFVSFAFVRTKTKTVFVVSDWRMHYATCRQYRLVAVVATPHNPRWSHVIRRSDDYYILLNAPCTIVWQSSSPSAPAYIHSVRSHSLSTWRASCALCMVRHCYCVRARRSFVSHNKLSDGCQRRTTGENRQYLNIP